MLEQTLYPALDRTVINWNPYSTISWPVTQTTAQAGSPPQSDATFDRLRFVGGEIFPGWGFGGLIWDLDDCTYLGSINKVIHRIRCKNISATNGATIQPMVGAIPDTPWNHAAVWTNAIDLTTEPAWYEFQFGLNPRDSTPWTADSINALKFGWYSFLGPSGEGLTIEMEFYEYELEIHSQDPASSLIARL